MGYLLKDEISQLPLVAADFPVLRPLRELKKDLVIRHPVGI